MTSLILLTIDRYEITKRTIDMALRHANSDYELLVFDNGSKDQRTIDYIASLNPVVHIKSPVNIGMQKAQNTLISMAKGDYICLIGNDILLPSGWLHQLVKYNQDIPDSGVSGIHCVMHKPPIVEHNGRFIRKNETVFGTMFWNRSLMNKIGYINEAYSPYGMDDSDFSYRSRMTGHVNYYIPALTSEHIGHDVGENSEYRKMKDVALENSEKIYKTLTAQYDSTGNYYVNRG